MAQQEDPKAELYTVKGSDGVEYGPCNITQIKDLVKQGRIKATTMMFIKSKAKWSLSASIPEVRAYLRAYSPQEDSTLNKLRHGLGDGRDSRHALREMGRISTVKVRRTSIFQKVPFWKKWFS